MTRTPVTVSAVDQMSLAALLVQAGVRSMHEDAMLTNDGYNVSFIGQQEPDGPYFALVKAPSDQAYAAIDAAFGADVNIARAPVRVFLGDPIPSADIYVTRKQLFLELAEVPLGDATLYEAMKAAVSQAPLDVQIWFETVSGFERHNPMVLAMLPVLGVTDEAADAIWLRAKDQPE